MESKVDPILPLTNAGQKVSGSGPISWEPYEIGAIVTVIIAQPQQPSAGTMQLAVASGSTGWLANGTTNWTATAKVRGLLALQPGAAVAYAHGMIEYAPGIIKPYDWTVHIVLQ